MGKKYRKYKNSVEKYLSSEKGQRFFHVMYSVGAAVVIIGALFKINNYPMGGVILAVGMVVEAIIFALSAFDRPSKEYKWEEVYPVLGDSPEGSDETEETKPAIQSTAYPANPIKGSAGTVIINGAVGGGASNGVVGGGGSAVLATPGAESLEASEKYAEQLTTLSESMAKFAETTNNLSEVSAMLLGSFQSINENSEGIGNNTKGYISQMESLNRNLAGLNTIYEIQLKGVSGQINTIEEINAGLDRMKKLYDGSLADSSIFKTETERMAQQLAELNRVYARMLQAMTTNMNMGMGGFNNPSQGEVK